MSARSGQPRSGRRPGPSTTREEILAAARERFAESGYAGTSLRSVALRAGVDPALVHRFYGSKEGLLTAALDVAMQPAEVLPDLLGGDRETLGERVVGYFLRVWGDPERREVLVGMLRSAATHEQAADLLRRYIGGQVLDRVAGAVGGPDAQLRATLAGSQLVGLAMARYVVRLEPLASASPEVVAAAVAPTLQRYLLGELPSAS